jgi:hypothetical protein
VGLSVQGGTILEVAHQGRNDVAMTRSELKTACLSLLDKRADIHPSGHQAKLAARYSLATSKGRKIGLMFEKSDHVPAHLWVPRIFALTLFGMHFSFREYPIGAGISASYSYRRTRQGRHSALMPMADMAKSDLVRFTIASPTELATILSVLVETN